MADVPEHLGTRHFRDVLGRFASGVTVVTATGTDGPVGMTCQSFCSVSLDPPLVLFVPARTARAWAPIEAAGAFCVNVLAADQVDVSVAMSRPVADRFAGLAWTPSAATGSPVLDGAVAHVDCTLHAVHDAGDHVVVLGRVVGLEASRDVAPLLFHRGRYTTTDTNVSGP